MFSFPSFGEFCVFAAILLSLFLTILFTVLKLCGVLIVSWWFIAAPLLICIALIGTVCLVLALFGQ